MLITPVHTTVVPTRNSDHADHLVRRPRVWALAAAVVCGCAATSASAQNCPPGPGIIRCADQDDPRCWPCPAELNGDCFLDVFDIFIFLQLFKDGDPSADYALDGVIDVFDVFAYLLLFSTECDYPG